MKRALMCAVLLMFAADVALAASPIKDEIGVLTRIFLNHQSIKTKTQDPARMVFRYLYVTYLAEDVKATKFKNDATRIESDSATAGTLTLNAAVAAVRDGVDYMLSLEDVHTDVAPAEKAKWKDQATQAIRRLKAMGVSFGFDGRRQNEGPTPYLLILDPVGHTVTGIELTPTEF